MPSFEQQFNMTPPQEGDQKKKRGAKIVPPPDNLELPIDDKLQPLENQEESVSFLGVNVPKGGGGERVPNLDRFSKDVLTDFDYRLMRDIAVALKLNQGVLIEGGSGIGKSRTIDRMCALLNRESYYANCHDFDADVLIGKMTTVEGTQSGFGWRDGLVVSAVRNGGVLFLDEYNFMKGETRAALHEIIDAILQGKDEITLVDNHGERVPVHPDFRIIAAQNPPGGKHGDREVLDPAQYTRFSHIKLPEDLPREVKRARALGFLGKDNEITVGQDEYLLPGGISLEMLKEVPGIENLFDKYIEFTEAIEAMVEKGELGANQSQPPYFSFQRDYDRVISFVLTFYRGDLNETFHKALNYYFAKRLESSSDRARVEDLIALIKYEPPQDSRRQTLPEPEVEPAELESEKEIDYLIKSLDTGKEKFAPGQLVKRPGGEISVFVGVSKEDGLPVFKPYKSKTSSGKIEEKMAMGQEDFLKDTFKKWGASDETISEVKFKPELKDPKKVKPKEWGKMKDDIDTDKLGEYTLNPEMTSLTEADFERLAKEGKVRVETLPDKFNGKPLYEVAQYIMKTYGAKYHIPGIEYWQWLLANPDKSPAGLMDGNYHFFFGSTLRDPDGHWCVPSVDWRGSGWFRDAGWLDSGWGSSCRVVLLER